MNFLKQADISVVSGTRSYDLPSDFYKLVGIAIRDSSKPDGYSVIDRVMWEERYDFTYLGDKYSARYFIRNQDLFLMPTPTWSDTVRIEYIPKPTVLVNPSDTHEFYNNYQEWIILDCCIKCCALLKQDPSIFVGQLQKVEDRMISIDEVDRATCVSVVDVHRSSKYDVRQKRRWW